VYVARSGLPERVDGGPLPTQVRRPFVLALGTEEPRKDVPLAVRAFERLASATPDLTLVIAGAPGGDSRRIDATIADLDAAIIARITRLGPVSEPTKWGLLAAAEAVVYPSLDEGFGFPVLEAQLAGTPVVAADVGAMTEVGGDGVALVAGRDPAELAATIERVLHDTATRLGLITAGFENTDRFDWDRTARVHVDHYRTIRKAT
jgi:glycosyltransferase involved in cell wall biosynthesis